METILLECAHCEFPFEKRKASYLSDHKKGRVNFYCSSKCVYESRRRWAIGVCKECGNSFKRKHNSNRETLSFCSRQCGARNAAHNRTRESNRCSECGGKCSRQANRCVTCRYGDVGSITLKELKDKFSISQYHAKIRGNARSAYRRSGLPVECKNCGYDLHVDIAHVIPVKAFVPESKLSVVNDIGNLIALCKRCHWEFDNGYLTMV